MQKEEHPQDRKKRLRKIILVLVIINIFAFLSIQSRYDDSPRTTVCEFVMHIITNGGLTFTLQDDGVNPSFFFMGIVILAPIFFFGFFQKRLKILAIASLALFALWIHLIAEIGRATDMDLMIISSVPYLISSFITLIVWIIYYFRFR